MASRYQKSSLFYSYLITTQHLVYSNSCTYPLVLRARFKAFASHTLQAHARTL